MFQRYSLYFVICEMDPILYICPHSLMQIWYGFVEHCEMYFVKEYELG